MIGSRKRNRGSHTSIQRVLLLLPLFFLTVSTAADQATLSELREKGQELDSLTAQVHQLSLQSESKMAEAEARMSESPFTCQGRLTVVTGTPVPTTDTSNATTIYFTPYQGSRIALYNGTYWTIHEFTERSLALSGLSGNNNYDVFIYNNAGTLTLELSAVWTNAATRADAISLQDGVYVKTSATTRRYLGTIRVTSATQTQDTSTQRFVWNYFNRTRRLLARAETANNWNYTTAAFRSVNNSATNRAEFVKGINEVPVHLRAMLLVTADGTARDNVSTSFALDTTTVSITLIPRGGSARNVVAHQLWTEMLESGTGLGYHYIQWVEYGNGTAFTAYGDAGDASGRVASGFLGWIDG